MGARESRLNRKGICRLHDTFESSERLHAIFLRSRPCKRHVAFVREVETTVGQHPVFAAHDQQAIEDMARCRFGNTRGRQHGVKTTRATRAAPLSTMLQSKYRGIVRCVRLVCCPSEPTALSFSANWPRFKQQTALTYIDGHYACIEAVMMSFLLYRSTE